ncbi:MAG: hypothetical protein R3281_10100 [Balneolaceae bacterium]|nr:hypothetical protein [Balneolaceae bacterium]
MGLSHNTDQAKRGRPHPVLSLAFWRAYLVTMRPYLLYVSGSAALVGMAFIPDPDSMRVLVLLVPCSSHTGSGRHLPIVSRPIPMPCHHPTGHWCGVKFQESRFSPSV